MRLPFALAFVSAAAATARRQGDDASQLRGGASSTAASAPRSSSSQTHPASNLASAAPRLAEALVHPDAVVDLVTDAPLDPAAHPELLAASDETGSDDEPRPSSHAPGRALMPNHAHYVESACNADLSTAACVDWSDLINGTDISLAEVKIPCGACVTLDASPGQPLFGSTLQFGEGINVVGKLVIPNDADVDIVTKYVYVQGELVMPAPAAGSSTGISSAEGGSRTKITLYGNEELTFVADKATDNSHLEGKSVSSKAFVVAGGKVDIAAIDPTCPSWVKLQSVQYGTSLPNVALGKTATQSSTYNNIANVGPESAVDGNDNSFMHTFCWQGINQWWEVDLADTYTVSSLHIVNRLDCCGGRLHDFDIFFLDENKNLVDSIFHPGWLGNRKDISVDRVNARYVKIQLGDQDCLQLGEVEVFGWLAPGSVPVETLDVLTLGDDAARCWGAPGSRLMLTSDTYDWNDSHVVTVADVPGPSAGKVYVHPLPKKKTAVDETFGYPDFAVEVALLDRSLIIEGAEETGEFADIGGHIIVLHTPHVQQHLEGALLQNMGQMGRLGRYPVHFHMSESVYGSTIAKNVIYKSNQRCIVVHGSHNVTISENVAYDTKGHCYMLEDGGEWDNTFSSNLGALTKALPRDIIRPGETDHFPSTFWMTNPSNHWVGNVAAGAAGPGFWFELKLRGPSADLAINQDVNPKYNPLGTFDDNVAHSNNFRAGITTYETGYQAPEGTTWSNIRSYKNKGSGLFQHGTKNIRLNGGLLADNREAARNFGHDNAVYDGVEIIGRSEHVQSLIDQGRISESCGQAGGISIQPNEGMGRGTTIMNSHFSGFDYGCTGGRSAAIYVENDQVRNGVFDAAPSFTGNTFGANDKRISGCLAINNSPDNWVRYIAVEDDGSMGGMPGFYIQDEPAVTEFIDASSCEVAVENSCLRFCPGACLRLGNVQVSQDLTTVGFKMIISDGATSATVLRLETWFSALQSHLNAQVPFVLPAPTGDKYSITFTDGNDQPAWPGYANLQLEREPTCSGALADASQIDLIMPPPDGRCEDLFHQDDFPAVHGWQHFFAGMDILEEAGSWVIRSNRRKHDRGHVSFSRNVDASCIAGLGGRTYSIFGKIRITDANGNYVQTDGTSNASPKLSFIVDGVKTWTWNLATNGDGTWAEFSFDAILPIDTSSAWKGRLLLNEATKMEFEIADWGLVLVPSASEPPTLSPSKSPTESPVASTSSPSKSPTAGPTASPSEPPTSPPSKSPSSPPTASPVASTSSPSKSPTAGPTVSPSTPPSSPPSTSPSTSPTTPNPTTPNPTTPNPTTPNSCVNDPSWTYITNNGKTKRCDPWVQRKPSRRCNKINDEGVSSFDACPAYCNPACL